MNLGIRHTLNPFWDRYESDSKKVGFDSGQGKSDLGQDKSDLGQR